MNAENFRSVAIAILALLSAGGLCVILGGILLAHQPLHEADSASVIIADDESQQVGPAVPSGPLPIKTTDREFIDLDQEPPSRSLRPSRFNTL